MSKTLTISPTLKLPLQAVVETFAILAVKRAGKSNGAVVMAEEMYDAGVPWVAIDPKGDWWGVRAAGSAPGLENVIVFGGLHGDVPLEPSAGNLIADLVVDHRITCVLDVSEMTKADQRRFLIDFVQRLYKRNTEAMHVFCEEADEYIPQRVMGENAKLVGAFETLVKRGGFRGIGITLITQRSASLNKDVLTQAGTLIAMRTPSPQDRKAVLAWVEYHQASKEMLDELPMLEAGEAWFFSPQTFKTVEKFRFRQRRTFDSGATPEVGAKPRPAAKLADVDLSAIKEAMAETIERAKADDPKFWRAQHAGALKELHELAARYETLYTEHRNHVCEAEQKIVEVSTVSPEAVEQLLRCIDDLGQIAESWAGTEDALQTVANQLSVDLARATQNKGYVLPDPTPAAVRTPPLPRSPHSSPRSGYTSNDRAVAAPVAPRGPAPGAQLKEPTGGSLGKGERQILIAIASYDGGVTNEQLTVLTGYKRSSRNTYLQRLTSAGFAVRQGDRIVATAEGVAELGDDYEPLPRGAALRDYWLNKLGSGGEHQILGALIRVYPEGLTGEEIDEATGYKRSSRNTYLQRLRARELVTLDDAVYNAAVTLFDN